MLLKAKQDLDAILVVFPRLFLRGESRTDERQEIVLGEVLQRRYRLPVADTDLALRERGPVRRLHLLGDALVGLLRALADRLAVPGELVPPILAFGLLIDRHEDPLFLPRSPRPAQHAVPTCVSRTRLPPAYPPAGRSAIQDSRSSGRYRTRHPTLRNAGPRPWRRHRRSDATLTLSRLETSFSVKKSSIRSPLSSSERLCALTEPLGTM